MESKSIQTTSSQPRSLLPAILQPDLVKHLISMRYGTDKTTPQAEYARGALESYKAMFKDFPEIDLVAGVKAAMEKQ